METLDGEELYDGAVRRLEPGEAHARYVVGFLLVEGMPSVLLIRKKRPQWQAGRLNGPGGKVEPGETFLDAMRREFEEEIGVRVERWEHFVTLRGEEKAGQPYEVAFFRGSVTLGGAHYIIDDARQYEEQPEWVRTDPLPSDVLPNLRFLIPMARYPHRPAEPYTLIEGAANPQDVQNQLADSTGQP